MEEQTQEAGSAWETGRTFYVTTARLERADGGEPDDAAGLLQAVESIGWRLDHVGYVGMMRTEIPGGYAGIGGIGVLGKNRYVGDLVAVYTFRRGKSMPAPPVTTG